MKLATLLSDALRGLGRRPVTVAYPAERKPTPPNVRGRLTWDPSQCTGCGLCTKDCPSGAIELAMVDKATKRLVLRYDADQCVYCGQCGLSCRFNCLTLSPTEWELAELTREPFRHYYGQPSDVAVVVAAQPAPPARPPR